VWTLAIEPALARPDPGLTEVSRGNAKADDKAPVRGIRALFYQVVLEEAL
jgi:hypothetical protein